MNSDADYFTKHNTPIHQCQMQPRYIHITNLVRTISRTIRLFEGVLNQLPCTQSCIDSLKSIQSKPQSMTNKFPTFRWLNRSRQYIMWLINLYSYFYETQYNIYVTIPY